MSLIIWVYPTQNEETTSPLIQATTCGVEAVKLRQDGKAIESPPIKILPEEPDSITDKMCKERVWRKVESTLQVEILKNLKCDFEEDVLGEM